MQPIEEDKKKDSKSKASDAVINELIKQTGDLGNYVLKAFFVTVAGLFTLISVLATLIVRLSPTDNYNLTKIPAEFWLVSVFILIVIWLNVTHLAFVHVRASIAIARLTEENQRKYFSGNKLFFLRFPLKFSKFLLRKIEASHDVPEKKTSDQKSDQGTAIPTASVAILEGYILFSAIFALIIVILIVLALRAIFA